MRAIATSIKRRRRYLFPAAIDAADTPRDATNQARPSTLGGPVRPHEDDVDDDASFAHRRTSVAPRPDSLPLTVMGFDTWQEPSTRDAHAFEPDPRAPASRCPRRRGPCPERAYCAIGLHVFLRAK